MNTTQQLKQQSPPPFPLYSSKLSRFTVEEQSEECAFSGQIDFSRNGRGKNRENCHIKAILERKNPNPLYVFLTATTATTATAVILTVLLVGLKLLLFSLLPLFSYLLLSLWSFGQNRFRLAKPPF